MWGVGLWVLSEDDDDDDEEHEYDRYAPSPPGASPLAKRANEPRVLGDALSSGRASDRLTDLPQDDLKRRFAHIHAEQKRRNKLKDAFSDLKDKVRWTDSGAD